MSVNNNVNLRSILKNKVVKKFLKENKLLNELSNKSLFMIENNNLKIDIDGDGKYDKNINCIFNQEGEITLCNNLSNIDNSQENVVDILNTWLKLKFGDKDLGFSFGNSYIKTNNTPQEVPTNTSNTENLSSFNYQPKETIEKPKLASFNPETLKQQLENLNIDGIKIEVVKNYKPHQT